jgi:hypothetical protein
MKQRFLGLALGIVAILVFTGGVYSGGTYLYQNDDGTAQEVFNNSDTNEVEDNWVANSYTVVDGATRLLSINWTYGNAAGGVNPPLVAQPATVAIYQGSDIYDPQAGGGLVLLQSNDVVFDANPGDTVTLDLGGPVDFNVGDVFYAAILIRAIPGTIFPMTSQIDGSVDPILGQSFWDVGPGTGPPHHQTGDYDINNTSTATVLGFQRDDYLSPAQDAGNLWLRVNATVTP